MKMGTKSLLFGCHQIILHPIFVLIAWIKLYKKFPPWRVVLAIIIHDWGLWGCKEMDDEEGEAHPEWAARVMEKLYGNHFHDFCISHDMDNPLIYELLRKHHSFWSMPDLIKYHSRFLAKRDNRPVSPLCLADKLGTALMPTWLWVGLGRLTGEVWEYIKTKKYEEHQQVDTPREKFKRYRELCDGWVSGEISLCPWEEQQKEEEDG